MTARPATMRTASRSVGPASCCRGGRRRRRASAPRAAGRACRPRPRSSPDGRQGARPPDRLGDAAGDGDVVVLDQDRVVEAEAVVGAAAAAHGVFLEGAQAGRGLPRVADLRAGVRRPRRPAPRSRWRRRERWQRKFSATRSAARTARAGPSTRATTSPALERGRRRDARRVKFIAGSSSRKARSASARPASTPGFRAR